MVSCMVLATDKFTEDSATKALGSKQQKVPGSRRFGRRTATAGAGLHSWPSAEAPVGIFFSVGERLLVAGPKMDSLKHDDRR